MADSKNAPAPMSPMDRVSRAGISIRMPSTIRKSPATYRTGLMFMVLMARSVEFDSRIVASGVAM
ncbi:hypothetical protein GCM10023116_11920 [Kistimonas scapharcae]|uniref:Uncharacterized protein n=1 Tax=Kistimonas scapharcae TaxID=1036133 RepID=A0ABP8UYB4_9GAMM